MVSANLVLLSILSDMHRVQFSGPKGAMSYRIQGKFGRSSVWAGGLGHKIWAIVTLGPKTIGHGTLGPKIFGP